MPVPLFFGSLPAVQALDEKVVVVSKKQIRDFENGVIEFTDGVTILYGPTIIVADKVRYTDNATGRFAVAEGKVSLIDPEGELSAETIRIDWLPEGTVASAQNVNATLAGAYVKAKTFSLKPNLWTFTGVEGTTCPKRPPLINFSSRKLTIVPGKSGKVEMPTISVFGKTLGSLPTQSFNLDRRAQGIGIPSFTAVSDQGAGVTWGGSVLLTPQQGLSFGVASFQDALPTYGITYSRSFLKPEESNALLTPRDELGERFNYGWFDTVEVPNFDADLRYLREKRNTLAFASSINRFSANTFSGARFTRPIEAIYEQSGPLGSGAWLGQLKLQSVGSQRVSQTGRAVLTSAFAPQTFSISPKLSSVMRFDNQTFFGRETYGWVRSQVGLAYKPHTRLTIGAAYVASREYGTSLFEDDRLQFQNGFHFRASLNLGPTKIEYLYKKDDRFGWYDREFSVNQVIGCLEAYIMRRQVPQEYRLGIKLRVDQFVDLLQKRKLERSKTNTKTVVSGENR